MQRTPGTSERTPLVQPTYMFESSVTRQYQKRLRNFQCGVCVILIVILTITLLLTVSFHLIDDIDSPTTVAPTPAPANLTSTSPVLPLLQLKWPLPGQTPPAFASSPTKEAISNAVLQGAAALKARRDLERLRAPLDKDSPASRAQRAAATSANVKPLAETAFATEQATKALLNG